MRRHRRPPHPSALMPVGRRRLLGDPGKAKRKLGWTPTTTLAELVREMVESDYVAARRDSLVKQAGTKPSTITNDLQLIGTQDNLRHDAH